MTIKSFTPLTQIKEEILSPEKFLSLTDEEKLNISRSEIIPPRLGKNHFGKIKVYYRTATYKKLK